MFSGQFHRTVLISTILMCLTAGALQASSGPDFIWFRATLSDDQGEPVSDGVYRIHFSIYAQEGDVIPIWEENDDVATLHGGFKVQLGKNTAFLEDTFDGTLRWIGIKVEDDLEMSPRTQIGSVPWALNAAFAASVAHGAVGSDELAEEAVGPGKIATGAVGNGHLADGAVGPGKIGDSAVGHGQIIDGAVGQGKIGDNAVGHGQIIDGAVGPGKIGDNAVGQGQLVDGAVGPGKIAAGAVGLGHLAVPPTGSVPGQIIKWNGISWGVGDDDVMPGEMYWQITSSNVLMTEGAWGLARSGANLWGNAADTHINLGAEDSNTGSAENAAYCVVGGGYHNSAQDDYSTVSGGRDNSVLEGTGGTIGGGQMNNVHEDYATIGGGVGNEAVGYGATIAGGLSNLAETKATVSGGELNHADGPYCTIGGGQGNLSSTHAATVAGGGSNHATGVFSTVSGGQDNRADGSGSTIGGGRSNNAPGSNATIPGGYNNTAEGDRSFAAGTNAKAPFNGSIVLSAREDDLPMGLTQSGKAGQMVLQADAGIYITSLPESAPSDKPLGNLIDTSTGAYLSLSGTWQSVSDVNAKENFEQIDANQVLAQVAGLDVTRWNYKVDDSGAKHIGPTAQDFHRQFGVGIDDKTISGLDAAGIALAAIKALNEKTEALERSNRETEDLQRRVDELTRLVEQLLRNEGRR